MLTTSAPRALASSRRPRAAARSAAPPVARRAAPLRLSRRSRAQWLALGLCDGAHELRRHEGSGADRHAGLRPARRRRQSDAEAQGDSGQDGSDDAAIATGRRLVHDRHPGRGPGARTLPAARTRDCRVHGSHTTFQCAGQIVQRREAVLLHLLRRDAGRVRETTDAGGYFPQQCLSLPHLRVRPAHTSLARAANASSSAAAPSGAVRRMLRRAAHAARASRRLNRRPDPNSASEELAQHVLQDASVPVVLALLRRIDAHRRRELAFAAVRALGASRWPCGLAMASTKPVDRERLLARQPERRSRSRPARTRAAGCPCRRGSSGGCARSSRR